MNKQIPIIFNHDYSEPPVGYLNEDGEIVIKKESGITPEQLVNANIGYIAKKVVDGAIVEAELTHLNLTVKTEVEPSAIPDKADPSLYSPLSGYRLSKKDREAKKK